MSTTPAASSGKSTGAQQMSSEETIAFLEGHEDECFALAKRLANAISYDNGPRLNALRMWNILNPILTSNARLGQENAELRALLKEVSDWALACWFPDDINDRIATALRPADSPQVKEKAAPSSVPATPRAGEGKTS